MKKKSFKIFLIFLISILLCSCISTANPKGDADSFLEDANMVSNGDKMNSAISDVAGMLTGIGIIVAVIVAAILGIQFIRGSMEQQAKVKEAIIPYIIGCIVVFGALGIWRMVIEAFNNSI